ncbi:hypothetical protein J6590_071203 [Homalodisca vitripennis]|nr:hypothetical protein J6590_071203 [Homalodisca vitripennis]
MDEHLTTVGEEVAVVLAYCGGATGPHPGPATPYITRHPRDRPRPRPTTPGGEDDGETPVTTATTSPNHLQGFRGVENKAPLGPPVGIYLEWEMIVGLIEFLQNIGQK